MQKNNKRLLLTGGCGFIGHHFVEHILKNTEWDIVILDRLNYASNGFDRLRDIEAFDDKRVSVLTADFTKPIADGLKQEIGDVNYIVHMGAETHVDNSIKNPEPFVMSNVLGTMRMLDFAREIKPEKFIQFSTDEVYGPAPGEVLYKESDRHNPTNPYAATKSGAEMLAMAYANCYNVPVMITNTMNVFGERQHPEKFIPGTIKKILKGEKVIIHGNKDKTKAGTRFYIHARNVASALFWLIKTEKFIKEAKYFIGEDGLPYYRYRYNIVGELEVDNLQLAKLIYEDIKEITTEGKFDYEIVDFHSARPGHDLRYGLDGSKLKGMGYEIPKAFEESLKKTVEWFLDKKNKRWLE